MAELAALPWFLCKANYRGIVPDTLDVGIRPDQFRPWSECRAHPARAGWVEVVDQPHRKENI